MATDTDQPSQDTAPALTCTAQPSIAAVAAEWDALVPRDLPHLRAGFLRAIELGAVVLDTTYLLVRHEGRLVGTGVAYTVPVITPDGERQLRLCGSPISNSECGVCFDPALSPAGRRQALGLIAEEMARSVLAEVTLLFKEFRHEAVAEYANELERLGFFPVEAGPATELALPWDSFDAYVNAMEKRYRQRVRKDLKAGQELELSLLDSFAELAPAATALYTNVLARAAYAMERATEAFFAAVSDFDQAKLLVARRRGAGELVGINLLLFGDSCMHNLYIGFDYASNEEHHTYFNLVEYSIRLAIERKCKVVYFGPGSYEFKARLGALPVAVTSYLKNRIPPVHAMLLSSKDKFPKGEFITHDVFRTASSGTE